MKKVSRRRAVIFIACIIFSINFISDTSKSITAFAKTKANTIWEKDQILGYTGEYDFAGIYEFDNLTINDNVTVYSSGISQLVIKVKGTLTLGKNACIRVRNGFYSQAPENEIEYLTSKDINTYGKDAGEFRAYDLMFGRGGDGGNGTDGIDTRYGTNGGGGGGGGYGGGNGGIGGAGGIGSEFIGYKGENGSSYGVQGSGNGAIAGTATDLGVKGNDGKYGGNAGDGGGGNGGDGGKGHRDQYVEAGGSGGGGGGYGGGVLTIIAKKIVYDDANPPKFIVSGQVGGRSSGNNGKDGEGGLIIINSSDYKYSMNHWNLGTDKFGEHTVPSINGGHGIVTGNPQKVFINGVQIINGNEDVNVKTADVGSLPKSIIKAIELLKSRTVGKKEGNVTQAAKNVFSKAIKEAVKVRDGKYTQAQAKVAIDKLEEAIKIFDTSVIKSLTMKIGDYVQFGSYLNRPLKWRIINLDNDGSPLLFSEEIISIKAFDATEKDGGCGSNKWENSNIREWLNSSDVWVSYTTTEPSGNWVYMEVNSYDREPGFLYNFTDKERDRIKEVKHKSILSEKYAEVKTGGAERFTWDGNFTDLVTNYDKAYYMDVVDKVFLLDLQELHVYVYDRGYEYTKVSSQGVINKNKYYDINNINYWLRQPNSFSYDSELCVKPNGEITSVLCFIGNDGTKDGGGGGIVPALYLKSSMFISGSGTKKDPYTVID